MRTGDTIVSALVLIVFLLLWQYVPGALGVPAFIIPPFADVIGEFGEMYGRDRVLYHTMVTGLTVLAGFALGSLLGMAIGYVLGMFQRAEVVLSPYILALQIAPKVAFAPLFVIWFGYTVWPKLLVAVLIVFFPVMVNVLAAVRQVDRDMVRLVQSFNASRADLFWKLEFPASMPPLFAGLRIASTLAVIGVIVGELYGSNEGLGYLLTFAEGQGNTAMVFATIILMTVIGILAYVAVVVAEAWVLHYMPKRADQT